MKRILLAIAGVIVAVIAGLAIHYLRPPPEGEPVVQFAVADFTEAAHPVGSTTLYVKNFEAPFDDWGARYGGDAYRELIEQIAASGEPRTTVTEIWYPAQTTEGFPQATYGDYFDSNPQLLQGPLSFFIEEQPDADVEQLTAKLADLKRGSAIGAPAAAGSFPLVLFVHGLGGKRIDWNDAAEALAGQGYVVAAMTMTSDGTLPPIFNDPNSRYTATQDAQALANAYDIMAADVKVFPKFLEYLYGVEAANLSPAADFPDISEASAPPGGADRMTEMMARLFQQRVEDVASIIAELKVLALDAAECEAQFAARGLIGKPCGLLANRIDFERIGISGHSLGSITTQVALRQLPELKAGLGLNNGIPQRWEPQSHGLAPAGTAKNIEKPMLFLHGTEDAFVYFVFQLLFGDWYEAAGGDRKEIFLLPDELAPRTSEHSQPVVFAAYNRAVGTKMAVSVIDGNHDGIDSPTLTRFMVANGLGLPDESRRLPDNEGLLGAFPGPRFRVLGDAIDAQGQSFRLPTFIANYYLAAWFDWRLKGDAEARERLLNPPFAANVQVRQSGL